MKCSVVLSCEHASARVPAEYRPVFRGAAAALRSHRGSDLGARTLARQLARELGAPLFEARATRLLADPNRSLGHPQLLSEWSRRLTDAEVERAIARYWRPHRERVEREVRRLVTLRSFVLHVSVHSFTPRWHGVERGVDVALLYDPARNRERELSSRWLEALAELRPDLRLRRNHPYRGTADGLTKHLRGVFGARRYAGVELEISQLFPRGPAPAWRRVRAAICASLRRALTERATP